MANIRVAVIVTKHRNMKFHASRISSTYVWVGMGSFISQSQWREFCYLRLWHRNTTKWWKWGQFYALYRYPWIAETSESRVPRRTSCSSLPVRMDSLQLSSPPPGSLTGCAPGPDSGLPLWGRQTRSTPIKDRLGHWSHVMLRTCRLTPAPASRTEALL